MNNKKLLDRLESLESRRRRAADKPPPPFNMGQLWLFCIGLSKAPGGSPLDGYARACRYRGGTSELRAAAYGNPKVFARKHGSRPGKPEEVRLAVVEEFAREESGIAPLPPDISPAAQAVIDRMLARTERINARMQAGEAAAPPAELPVCTQSEVAAISEPADGPADGLLSPAQLARVAGALGAAIPAAVIDAARARQDDWVRAGIVIGPTNWGGSW